MSKNTFPPLISGNSSDFAGQRQLLGSSIVDSMLIQRSSNDLFFNPQNGLTGYGYDGTYYQNGVQNPNSLASWFSEPPGDNRGNLATFPNSALVLLTDAGVSILDTTSHLDMWMVFARVDQGAFTLNFSGQIMGYRPRFLSYTSGAILVSMSPDAGSQVLGNACIVIDFINDRAYVDVALSTNDAPNPNPVTGYLTGEYGWLKRMADPVTGLYGTLGRTGSSLGGFQAQGTWDVFGYSPVSAPVVVFDSATFNQAYSGVVSGSITNFNVAAYTRYQVVVSVYDNTFTLLTTTNTTVDQNGYWGGVTVGAGYKLVQVRDSVSGQMLGDNLSSAAWDPSLEVKHYYRATKSDPRSYVTSTPAYYNNTWDTANVMNPSASSGLWEVDLVRVADGVVLARSGVGAGLVRSFAVPSTDSRYDSLKNMCATTDQGMALLAASAHAASDVTFFEQMLQGTLKAQNSDGSWSYLYDTFTAQPWNPTSRDLGATALTAYALLKGVEALPTMPTYLKDAIEAACHAAMGWCTSQFVASGALTGLYKTGWGSYDGSGTYTDSVMDGVDTTAQVLLHAAFAKMFALFPLKLAVPQNYDLKASSLAAAINSVLWQPSLSRYAEGASAGGALSPNTTAYTLMFSALFCAATGDTARFLQLYQTATKTFRYSDADGAGYLDGVAALGYPAPANWIYPVVNHMVTMASTRDTSLLTQWAYNTTVGLSFRGFDSGWKRGLVFGNLPSYSEWESTQTTSWAICGQHSALRSSLFS